MLLAKIKELREREAKEAAAAAAETAPRPKPKKKRRQRRKERETKNEVALHGWRKVRIAGLKEAARRRRAQDLEVQDAPDGPIRRFRGHVGSVLCASVTPDGTALVTGGEDGDVRVWRMPADDDQTYEDGAEHCLLVLSGHTAGVCAVCVDERTGARVFSAGADNHVRVWELTKSPEGRVAGARLLHAMSHAAEDARARDLDPSDAWSRLQSMSRGRRAYSRTFSATPRVLSLAVTRDGARCFTGGTDRDLKVWDADAGALRVALAGHETPVGALARFHGDGAASTRVLTGSGDGTVRAWNLARSACEHAVEGHAGAALALAVARDDRRAYSVGAEGDVVGWRVAWTGAGRAEDASALGGLFVLFRVARAHRGAVVRCVAVTPGSGGADQGTLFTGGEDGVARAWRAADGAPVCALAGHADWVGGIATCARGKTLCSTSHDGSVIAWRVGKMTRREGVQRAAVQGFLDAVGGRGTQ